MANPHWQKGMKSANPEGRRKQQSVRSVKGMLERFIKRNLSPQKLQRLYNDLSAKEKLAFLGETLPYILPKLAQGSMDITFENLSDKDLDNLYSQTMSGIAETLQIGSPRLMLDDIQQPKETESSDSLPKKIDE